MLNKLYCVLKLFSCVFVLSFSEASNAGGVFWGKQLELSTIFVYESEEELDHERWVLDIHAYNDTPNNAQITFIFDWLNDGRFIESIYYHGSLIARNLPYDGTSAIELSEQQIMDIGIYGYHIQQALFYAVNFPDSPLYGSNITYIDPYELEEELSNIPLPQDAINWDIEQGYEPPDGLYPIYTFADPDLHLGDFASSEINWHETPIQSKKEHPSIASKAVERDVSIKEVELKALETNPVITEKVTNSLNANVDPIPFFYPQSRGECKDRCDTEYEFQMHALNSSSNFGCSIVGVAGGGLGTILAAVLAPKTGGVSLAAIGLATGGVAFGACTIGAQSRATIVIRQKAACKEACDIRFDHLEQ